MTDGTNRDLSSFPKTMEHKRAEKWSFNTGLKNKDTYRRHFNMTEQSYE